MPIRRRFNENKLILTKGNCIDEIRWGKMRPFDAARLSSQFFDVLPLGKLSINLIRL